MHRTSLPHETGQLIIATAQRPPLDVAQEALALMLRGEATGETLFWEGVWPRLRDAGWTADLRAKGAGFVVPGVGAAAPLTSITVRSNHLSMEREGLR